MFGLTHAYISTRVLDNIDDKVLLGSIAPDFVWNDTLIKKRANIHANAKEFFLYVKNTYPDELLFAKGVVLHSDTTGGVDLYSDDPKKGYAFINGKVLSHDIEILFGIDSERALDFSHNFVEAALDILLADNKPDFVQHFNAVVNNRQYTKYIPIIASFGNIPTSSVQSAFETLLRFYGRLDYTSISESVNKSLIPIAFNRFDTESSADKIEDILKKTILAIQPTYQKEITYIIEAIQQNSDLMKLLVL